MKRGWKSRRMGRVGGLGILALALAAGGCDRGGSGAGRCPGKEWEWQAPEAAGFSKARLEAFSRRVGGSGCVVQGGKMIHTWGGIARSRDVASAGKPFYAFLALKAMEEGRLGSLDDRVVRYLPVLEQLNPDLGSKDRDITFRHLLSQTSGYGLQERPGEAFAYNDYGTGLLVWALLHEVYQLPMKQFGEALAGPRLGEAIGFEDGPFIDNRHPQVGRVRISVRDMARFALLYLRGGEWNGRRVLRRDLFEEAMGGTLPADFPRTSGIESRHWRKVGSIGGGKDQKNHLGCLGYFWWFNHVTPDGGRFLPDAPPGTFMGSGYGGRFAMVVVPEEDLVVVWHMVYKETWDQFEKWSPLSEVGRFKVNEMLRELLAARTEKR